MELIAYILLILLATLTLLTESKLLYKLFFIPSVFAFMIIVRFSGFDKDIINYASELHSTGIDLYYLREFVFWFGSRIVYFFTQDEILAFLLMDIIWISMMVKIGNRLSGFNSKNINNAFLVIIVTSFPFVLGFENIYRQFFATIFALMSYSMLNKQKSRVLLFFLMAFFMHNIIALLIPIFFVKKLYHFNLSDRIQIALSISLFFVVSLTFLVKLKSFEITGVNLGVFYLLIFVALLIIGLIMFKNNIYVLFEKIPSLFFIVILMTGLVALNIDMIAERLGMMFICFVSYDLFKYSAEIEDKGMRSISRVVLMLLFSLPTLFFENARNFLL